MKFFLFLSCSLIGCANEIATSESATTFSAPPTSQTQEPISFECRDGEIRACGYECRSMCLRNKWLPCICGNAAPLYSGLGAPGNTCEKDTDCADLWVSLERLKSGSQVGGCHENQCSVSCETEQGKSMCLSLGGSCENCTVCRFLP